MTRARDRADFSLPDNENLIFGNSDDFKIVHSSSSGNRIVTEDGELKIAHANPGGHKLTLTEPGTAGGTELEFNANTTGGYQRINAAQTSYPFDIQHGGTSKFRINAQGATILNGVAVSTTLTDTSNSGSVTLDFDSYQNFILTLTGNVTLANPSTENAGQTGFIIFIQDGTGGRTVSLGTDYETAGAAGLTLSSAASAVDIVPYVTQSAGNILLGTPQLAFS